jgi:hypothetical protein
MDGFRSGAALPPIEVYELDDRYYVADGNHRRVRSVSSAPHTRSRRAGGLWAVCRPSLVKETPFFLKTAHPRSGPVLCRPSRAQGAPLAFDIKDAAVRERDRHRALLVPGNMDVWEPPGYALSPGRPAQDRPLRACGEVIWNEARRTCSAPYDRSPCCATRTALIPRSRRRRNVGAWRALPTA